MLEHDVVVEIADGRLIEALDAWRLPFPACPLFYPSRQVTPALRALIDALRWTQAASGRPSIAEPSGPQAFLRG